MPKPDDVDIEDVNRWPIPHRQVQPEEIVALAKNLLTYDGQPHKGIKHKLLDFLNPADEKAAQQAWSDIWGNLVHLLGLGYTRREDPTIRATPLAKLLVQDPPRWPEYYTRLAMALQFPYAEQKHTGYKVQGIAVQPFTLIVQHLVALADLRPAGSESDFSTVYLTYDEIATVLMGAHSHRTETVITAAKVILDNRADSFDYTDDAPTGFELAKDDFHRLRFILEKPPVLSFGDSRVALNDAAALERARAVLVAFRPPVVIRKEQQASDRAQFFASAFSLARPLPSFIEAEEAGEHLADAELPARPVRKQGYRAYRKRRSRSVTRAELKQIQDEQGERGHDGEAHFEALLAAAVEAGEITNYRWLAEESEANAPYDFEVVLNSGKVVYYDAKTTNGPHKNAFNMSYAELVECAYLDESAGNSYRIARISDIDGSVSLLVSKPLTVTLRPIADYLAALDGIEPVVRSAGIKVKPESVDWETDWKDSFN